MTGAAHGFRSRSVHFHPEPEQDPAMSYYTWPYQPHPTVAPNTGATWVSTTAPAKFITITVHCPECGMGYETACWPLGEEQAETACATWLDEHTARRHPDA